MINTTVSPVAAIIDVFATALDRDDYEMATMLLHDQCRYEQTDKTMEGREQAIQSFRDSSDWARANLDKVVFEHELEGCQNSTGTIRFIDLLEHKGQELRHESLMHVTVAGDGSITKLVLEDLPGEKQKVADFLTTVGVSRT